MIQRRALMTCVTGILAGTLSTVAGAADIPDQVNGEPSDYVSLVGIQNNVLAQPLWVGQQFSPDLPTLTAVEFGILGADHSWNSMPDNEPIAVEIWNTAGGLPSVKLAESTRLTPLDPGGAAVWSGRFDLPAPLDVSAYVGPVASLAMLVTLPSPTTPGEWNVLFTGDAYGDGAWIESNNSGGSWNLRGDRDLIFRTYGPGAVLSVTNVLVEDVIALEFQSTLNVDYVLQFNTNLVVETWESAGWSVTGNGGPMLMYDATGFDSNKAYRVREN